MFRRRILLIILVTILVFIFIISWNLFKLNTDTIDHNSLSHPVVKFIKNEDGVNKISSPHLISSFTNSPSIKNSPSSSTSSSPSLSSPSLSPLPPSQSHFIHHTRNPHKSLWLQLWSENTTMLWGRTAYVDMRKVHHLGPVIVTFGFRETRKEMFRDYQWYCHISYTNKNIPPSCVSEIKTDPVEYQFANNHGWSVPSYFICPFQEYTNDKIPSAISLSSQSCKSKQRTPWIPIIDTKNQKTSLKTVGICLHKALFNIQDPQLVIQFIEAHKLFGVELFTIYIQDVSKTVKNILYNYSQEGLVDVVEWNVNISMDVRDFGQVALIHECLYRNRDRVKFLGFLDIDELFVPNSRLGSLPSVLQSVNQPQYGSFRFMHVFLHESSYNFSLHQLHCPHVHIPVYFKRYLRSDHSESHNIYGPLGSKTKVFVKPRAIVRMGRHSLKLRPIHKFAPGFTEFTVPGEMGLLHHYRNIIKDKKRVSYEHRPLIKDFTLRNYQDNLMNIINSKLCLR